MSSGTWRSSARERGHELGEELLSLFLLIGQGHNVILPVFGHLCQFLFDRILMGFVKRTAAFLMEMRPSSWCHVQRTEGNLCRGACGRKSCRSVAAPCRSLLVTMTTQLSPACRKQEAHNSNCFQRQLCLKEVSMRPFVAWGCACQEIERVFQGWRARNLRSFSEPAFGFYKHMI